MFFMIMALLLFPINAQISLGIQKPTVDNNNAKAAQVGNVNYETYVDKDGNVRTRAFRYVSQYKFKPTKPSGEASTETYTKSDGEVGQRKFRYGFQYKSDDEADEKPVKMRSQKLAAPTEASESGENINYGSTPSAAPNTEKEGAQSLGTATTPASGEELDKKNSEIMRKMQDLIQERQKLNSGNSK